MKRISLATAFILIISALVGCSGTISPPGTAAPLSASPAVQTLSSTVAVPSPSVEPATPGPTPEDTIEPTEAQPTMEEAAEPGQPEPSETVPLSNVYTSEALGLSFTVPESWEGKYRVEEGDGRLTVYFTPAEPIDSGRGELFSVARKTADGGTGLSRLDWEFALNDMTYVWGYRSIFPYRVSSPEYGLYTEMQNDIPSVFQSIQSVSGNPPDHVKRLWIEVVPQKAEYTTTMGLGIAFTLPESWIGKCRIVEKENIVSFYFKPDEPFDASIGDGYFFCIKRKTPDSDDDFMDGVLEFEVNGVAYISGTSTDAPYSEGQPGYDTYRAMCGDRQVILDSVREIQ